MAGEIARAARPRIALKQICAVLIASVAFPAAAQRSENASRSTSSYKGGSVDEILIIGQRPTVVGVNPIATFDQNAIQAIGATSMADLMKVIRPLARSADGSDPIFLLNGQRTSGYQEIGSLPPEAIDKVEVLPEPAALRFGYPPTRRVLNFITKRNFRQIEIRAAAGTTTRPGSSTAEGNFNLTRLHKDQRFTLALERTHTSSLFQSERHVLPDPDLLFDVIGNVTGLSGAEIDPALSQAAGQMVTVAPVPGAEADRTDLCAYAAAANQPRLFDVGPFRVLAPLKDGWKAEAVIADRLDGGLSGSLDLSAQQDTERALSGPAAVTLTVPASNPYSPFASTVLLHRYLTEADPLRARKTTTTLHGGGTLRGAIAGWLWDLTANVDRKRIGGTSENGIDVSAANAAIAAGANPFAPLDPSLLADRLVDRAHLLTRTTNSKLVVTGTPLELPAGKVSVTGTVEAERLSTSSVTRGANPFDLHLSRVRTEAGIALDVPLTSRANHALDAVGDLSLNGSANVRRVSGFGTLHDRTAGLQWTPFKGVQLLLQDKVSGTAPDMEKLASPTIRVANYPVFDYTTGRTDVVTLTYGGNPDLLAERKHVRSVGLNVKPFPKREIRVTATYENTDTRNQTGNIYALTAQFESLFPDLFVRDSTGHLVAVTFQPTNFYRERQRVLNIVLNANGPLGRKPPDSKSGKAGNRPILWAGAGPVIRFSDRLQLRPGTPSLDLLHGDTVTGGSPPHVTAYYFAGLGYLGNDVSIDGWYQASGRVRSENPASDLFFSPVFKLNFHASLSVHHFLRKEDWTRHLQLKLDVESLINAREKVRDRHGRVPNRFQTDLLDPIGRTVKLTVRKLF
jgi:hypothetical protein